jgi:hypothetical protein
MPGRRSAVLGGGGGGGGDLRGFFSLGDRVLYVRDFGVVPWGYRGTVVGVEVEPGVVDVVFDARSFH